MFVLSSSPLFSRLSSCVVVTPSLRFFPSPLHHFFLSPPFAFYVTRAKNWHFFLFSFAVFSFSPSLSFFLLLLLSLVSCRRRRRSSLFFSLAFFFLSFFLSFSLSRLGRSNAYSLRSTLPFAITSLSLSPLLFSLSLSLSLSLSCRCRGERKKSLLRLLVHRTRHSAKMYADSCFCLLTTLFVIFFLFLPELERMKKKKRRTQNMFRSFSFTKKIVLFLSLYDVSFVSRSMTKKNDSNHLPTVGGLTNNVVIVQQQSLSEQPHQQQQQHQQHHHHQQQHFVLPAMNNAAPMIITTPLGTITSCAVFL